MAIRGQTKPNPSSGGGGGGTKHVYTPDKGWSYEPSGGGTPILVSEKDKIAYIPQPTEKRTYSTEAALAKKAGYKVVQYDFEGQKQAEKQYGTPVASAVGGGVITSKGYIIKDGTVYERVSGTPQAVTPIGRPPSPAEMLLPLSQRTPETRRLLGGVSYGPGQGTQTITRTTTTALPSVTTTRTTTPIARPGVIPYVGAKEERGPISRVTAAPERKWWQQTYPAQVVYSLKQYGTISPQKRAEIFVIQPASLLAFGGGRLVGAVTVGALDVGLTYPSFRREEIKKIPVEKRTITEKGLYYAGDPYIQTSGLILIGGLLGTKKAQQAISKGYSKIIPVKVTKAEVISKEAIRTFEERPQIISKDIGELTYKTGFVKKTEYKLPFGGISVAEPSPIMPNRAKVETRMVLGKSIKTGEIYKIKVSKPTQRVYSTQFIVTEGEGLKEFKGMSLGKTKIVSEKIVEMKPSEYALGKGIEVKPAKTTEVYYKEKEPTIYYKEKLFDIGKEKEIKKGLADIEVSSFFAKEGTKAKYIKKPFTKIRTTTKETIGLAKLEGQELLKITRPELKIIKIGKEKIIKAEPKEYIYYGAEATIFKPSKSLGYEITDKGFKLGRFDVIKQKGKPFFIRGRYDLLKPEVKLEGEDAGIFTIQRQRRRAIIETKPLEIQEISKLGKKEVREQLIKEFPTTKITQQVKESIWAGTGLYELQEIDTSFLRPTIKKPTITGASVLGQESYPIQPREQIKVSEFEREFIKSKPIITPRTKISQDTRLITIPKYGIIPVTGLSYKQEEIITEILKLGKPEIPIEIIKVQEFITPFETFAPPSPRGAFKPFLFGGLPSVHITLPSRQGMGIFGRKKKAKYSPSIEAIELGIRGKPVGMGTLSLGLRPLPLFKSIRSKAGKTRRRRR